jgi:hypothetical protein
MDSLEQQRGYSSAGRALAWHARGHRFDPVYLHQFSSGDVPEKSSGAVQVGVGVFKDIVSKTSLK